MSGRAWLFGAILATSLWGVLAGSPLIGNVSETITLTGDQHYAGVVTRDLEAGTVIDARGALFRIANSSTASPTEHSDCEAGPLPTNPYPFRIYDSAEASVLGGRFDGMVPQASDWLHTYCNSAALGFWDSARARVLDLRVRRAWDGIRFAGASPDFQVARVWLSDVRDDCVENDFLLSGEIKDSLFDGCFSGVSMRAGDETRQPSAGARLTLTGVLMRLQPFTYRGQTRQGFALKVDAHAPSVVIRDSVIAMTDAEPVSARALGASWGVIAECRNNLLLWLSDRPWPADLARPPDCFRMLHGEDARQAWAHARQNWIDCHLPSARFEDDDVPAPSECDRSGHGGLAGDESRADRTLDSGREP